MSLRIETGRLVNESRPDRICTLCNSNNVEDQMHFLFHCELYNEHRNNLYVKARDIIEQWDNLPDCIKLTKLFDNMTRPFAKYIKNIFLLRRNTIFKS